MSDDPTFELTSYDQLHPGRFLKCYHLEGKPRTLTITKHYGEVMGKKKDGRPDIMGILCFDETDLQFGTNRTNQSCMVAIFGEDPSACVGKQITLKPDKDRFGRDQKDAVRILGSPSINDAFTHVVEYAKKSRRAPKEFQLVTTEHGGEYMLPSEHLRDSYTPPSADQDTIKKGIAAVADWPDDAVEALAKGLPESTKGWPSEAIDRMRKAVGERRAKVSK